MRLLVLLLLTSCTGYRFQSKSNPFGQYGIRSIAVPMFFNKSNFSNVSGPFTKEIVQTLLEFKDLRLSEDVAKSDAVLVGIIESRAKKKESIININSKRAESTFGEGVLGSNRDDFFVPSVNQMRMNLRIVVIKHPTPTEIKFFRSDMGKKALSSKVIFNENISINRNYLLKELRGDATKVLGTQNRGVERQTILKMAESAASSFKDMILYAF